MSVRFGRSLHPLALSASCLTLALLIYAASPLVTLWCAASALHRDDVRALRTALDWREVRAGLKSDLGPGVPVSLASVRQAGAQAGAQTGSRTGADQDDLPEFGSSFATTIVSHVIDDVMTPEHLAAMLSRSASDRGARPGPSMLDRVQHIGFVSPTEFAAAIRLSPDVEAPPVLVTLRVEKWQWKVTRIHVPDQLLEGGRDRT